MKRVFAGMLLCLALTSLGANAQEQKPKVWQINPTKPRFVELDVEHSDYEFHSFYDRKKVLPEPPKPKLGTIDQWRYDSCRSDAAKAPTSQGVYAGMQVCREKFGQ